MNDRFYRVILMDAPLLEVDVVELDVALVKESLNKPGISGISFMQKRTLIRLFKSAVRKGRFSMIDGDIGAGGWKQ